MKINIKKLLKHILGPLILGAIVGFITSGNYVEIVMPSFAPPKILFPIVWSILYILMGISRYIIETNGNDSDAVSIYNIQLFINLTWSFFFFTFKWFLFAFIWVSLLIILVCIMIYRFYKISKTSAFIQIPYLLWIIFASVLNFSVYLLN